MTSSDLGLSLTCEYNLANKTVANLVDLKLTGEITPSLYEESVVDSPNVLMRVADDQGMSFWIVPLLILYLYYHRMVEIAKYTQFIEHIV